MAKKRKQAEQRPSNKESVGLTLADSLNEDVLAKLKAAKKELTTVEREKEEERQQQIRRERKEIEDNKSFQELLKEY